MHQVQLHERRLIGVKKINFHQLAVYGYSNYAFDFFITSSNKSLHGLHNLQYTGLQ